MNVTYVKNLKEVDFDTIKVGECFEYDIKVYMKIKELEKVHYNAINLENGSISWFPLNKEVVPLDVELMVHEN